ncbi:alpha/beta fold hydrolase [Plastorhodobacter daqingensis]|uniref:Alpha/beta fold hydrolase n=1 Tax=Plastorhodobacter daqingensis TaxID=1387281 RepID=A0ABW2UL01_9RHOB
MMPLFTSADGTPLYYEDTGRGLPVLALPGLTRTTRDFDYLGPHLAAYRLIRMDYRGRGQSGWSGAANYTVPQEAADTLALLDHLGLDRAAVIGTSRGGLIGMFLSATAGDRLLGLCLNDIGPVIDADGLRRIADLVGQPPAVRSHEDAVAWLALQDGYSDVPGTRWEAEARIHFRKGPNGLQITYDPALREAFIAALEDAPADLWPLFDACAGQPLALIRGANSDLLLPGTVAEMRRRRPDMIFAEVAGRPHIPFLDEAESLAVVHAFLESCQ